jgi:TetR/AcrR family transcriptional regulator, tetracycline repressor protein
VQDVVRSAGRQPKERLRSAAIVARALAIVDAEGVDGLTIRRLAQDFAVSPMALYWHFKDKAQLLDGIADRVLEEVDLRREASDEAVSWLTELRGVLEALVAAVRPHPAVATLLPSRVLTSEPGLLLAERTLALLARGGFAADRAAELGTYLIEAVVALVSAEPGRDLPAGGEAREDAARVKRASLLALSPRRFPAITAAADALAECASPDAYHALGIDMLIAGVEGIASRTSTNSKPVRR